MTSVWLVMSNVVRHHMKLCYYLPLLCDFSYRRNDSCLVSHVERSETSHQAMLSSIHYYAISPIVEMTRVWLVMSNAVRHRIKLCYHLPLLCDFSYRRNDACLVVMSNAVRHRIKLCYRPYTIMRFLLSSK